MWSLESGVNFYTVDQQYSQSLIYTKLTGRSADQNVS